MVDLKLVEEVVSSELDEDVRDLSKIGVGRAHESFSFRTSSGDYILKASNDVGLEDRFQVEAPVNRLLARESGVSVPELIAFDNSKTDFDFMYFISSFETGVNLDNYESEGGPKFRYLSRERKRKVLESAGRQLGMVHSQTGFEQYGFLKCENNELCFRDKGCWSSIFKKIILEEQLANFPERFMDLQGMVESFVEENFEVVDTGADPCVIHQDFRWPNMKVDGDTVSAVFDWERALAGHHEYDLTKSLKSLVQVRSENLRKEYRKSFLKGYQKYMDLDNDWKKRKKFYRALRPVEALWTFESWTKGMSKDKKEEMAELHRSNLEERINQFLEEY